MLILAIESTCDETAAAVIDGELNILSSVVASQDELHARFGGVVPEIASRAHVERILPVLDQTLRDAGNTLQDLDAVAVATSPGLAGSLLIGLVAAKTLCVALDIPLISVDHLHAHIYACRLAAGEDVFPCVGFVVSGGHSHLFDCKSALNFELLGGTIDDAAGEAFDKVASLLGLPYPGGPAISKAAIAGDKKRYKFPRPLLNDKKRIAFSFSGLKTAVRYTLFPAGKLPDETTFDAQTTADIAASFQEAVVDCLVGKAELALQKTGAKRLCVGGGVAANYRLREQLQKSTQKQNVELILSPQKLCTDNAAMGAIAVEKYRAGLFEPLELDITPGLMR